MRSSARTGRTRVGIVSPASPSLAAELERQASHTSEMRERASRRLVLLSIASLVAAAGACRGRHDRVVFTDLAAAPGIREGAPVVFRGVEVGTVERLTLAHSAVRLALRIRRPDAPLRAGDRVAVHTVGLFGDRAIEIVPGPGDAAPLADGATLATVPPDTLAPAREAAATAVAKVLLAPLLHPDSTPGPRTTGARP